VPNRRLLAILELLAQAQGADYPRSLCSVATEITALTGAGIALLSDGPHYTSYCASDDTAHRLLDTEVILGEGPSIDACGSDVVIEASDLDAHLRGRWIAYAPAALALGARAVFAFPVRIGAIRIGALTFHRNEPGPLSDLQESDAYLLASVVGRSILATRAGAAPDELADELGLTLSLDFSVHQAAGMLAVQGAMGIGDAFVALKAHSFGSGVDITTLAQQVVQRQMAYDRTTSSWTEQLAKGT
jgi:GAF domain-containing protein